VVPARAASLQYKDYPHLKQSMGYLRAHLRLVLRERRKGVNIYIHGSPGTGKSELSRLLARELRAGLYEVSSEDDEGNAEVGNSRMNSLRMALTILSRQRAMLVFDEAEDIFGGGSIFHRSLASERKGWMNRLLETNPVPIIWISNSGQGLDPAYVRRFDFVFEVGVPPRQQRRQMIQKICQQSVSSAVVQQLAECPQLSAAVVARADSVANGIQAVLPGTRKEHVLQHLIKQTLVAQGHGQQALESTAQPIPAVFDLKYLNSAFSLPEFVGRIKAESSCRICLYGPPGTGKSTIGYWLANKLEQPLHLKRASDILSPYVGEAEQNIARIFKQAGDDKAILMIDEVDSFLQDRRQAQRGWEITAVNEMLTQMERFNGIFIASTNLVDGLDSAALRRFDLKIHIDYMRPDQVRELLQAYGLQLRLKLPSPTLLKRAEALSNATPGDFANVARQHKFRDFSDLSVFFDALAAECAMKDCSAKKVLGF
jgi:transitional endoplasmic reticulum ATPase